MQTDGYSALASGNNSSLLAGLTVDTLQEDGGFEGRMLHANNMLALPIFVIASLMLLIWAVYRFVISRGAVRLPRAP